MRKKIHIQIKGVHCKSCKSLIEAELKAMDGINNIDVNPETGKSIIQFDEEKISQNKIFRAIKKLNYGVQKTGETDLADNDGNYKIAGIAAVIIFIIIIGGVSVMVFGSERSTGVKSGKSKKPAETAKTAWPKVNDDFVGDRGDTVTAKSRKIFINENRVNDGNMHAYNYYSERTGKNIYFFVLKAPDGTYRAAANACEVCYGAKKGFTQTGDLVRCENCRLTYPSSKIAIEKGGCNPGPINKNVSVINGQLNLNVDDVEAVAYLF